MERQGTTFQCDWCGLREFSTEEVHIKPLPDGWVRLVANDKNLPGAKNRHCCERRSENVLIGAIIS